MQTISGKGVLLIGIAITGILVDFKVGICSGIYLDSIRCIWLLSCKLLADCKRNDASCFHIERRMLYRSCRFYPSASILMLACPIVIPACICFWKIHLSACLAILHQWSGHGSYQEGWSRHKLVLDIMNGGIRSKVKCQGTCQGVAFSCHFRSQRIGIWQQFVA